MLWQLLDSCESTSVHHHSLVVEVVAAACSKQVTSLSVCAYVRMVVCVEVLGPVLIYHTSFQTLAIVAFSCILIPFATLFRSGIQQVEVPSLSRDMIEGIFKMCMHACMHAQTHCDFFSNRIKNKISIFFSCYQFGIWSSL